MLVATSTGRTRGSEQLLRNFVEALADLPARAPVVTHGGHGTVIKALAAGPPCLVMPLGRDQPDNAARVVAHHAGLALRRSARPGRIAAAVTQLLEDRSHTEAAGELGRRIRAEADDRRIVAAVESVVNARL